MIRSRINMARQGHRFHIAPFPSKEKLSNHWAVLALVCFVTSFWRRNLVLDFDKTLTCLQPCASILRISFIVLSYFLDIFSSIFSPFYFAPKNFGSFYWKYEYMYRVSKSQLLRLFVWKKDRRRWFLGDQLLYEGLMTNNISPGMTYRLI